MRELTKAEEQVMQVVWSLEKVFVKDVLEALPEPKPAYNTVSTIIRILETKGFVGHESVGRSHKYYPLISRDKYAEWATEKLMEGYFGSSVQSLLSFFVKKEKLSLDELDLILKKMESK